MSAYLFQPLKQNSVRIIHWKSLRTKCAERSEAFSSLLGKVFFKNWEVFFVICDVILSISNTLFDNIIQWMNKMWISFGYNVEKYNVDELNSPWEKNCFAFFSWFTTLPSQYLEFTSQFAKCETIIRTMQNILPHKRQGIRESHDLVNPEKSGKSLNQRKNRIKNKKNKWEMHTRQVTHKSMNLWT